MKTGFHDPIEAKEKKEKKKSPWDFKCPPYDERSSCFLNAGTDYGVGHKQPVGREGTPKSKVSVLPFGRPKTMEYDHVSKHEENAEFIE